MQHDENLQPENTNASKNQRISRRTKKNNSKDTKDATQSERSPRHSQANSMEREDDSMKTKGRRGRGAKGQSDSNTSGEAIVQTRRSRNNQNTTAASNGDLKSSEMDEAGIGQSNSKRSKRGARKTKSKLTENAPERAATSVSQALSSSSTAVGRR